MENLHYSINKDRETQDMGNMLSYLLEYVVIYIGICHHNKVEVLLGYIPN